MEAIYTTTGMMLKPYKPSKAGMILRARSIWIQGAHALKPVTAYTMKDPTTGGKRLVTYKCHPKWLQEQIPDIVITKLPPNHVEKIEPFTLNPDIIPNEIQSSATQAVLDNNFKSAFFNIPTAAGKTLLAIYLTSIIGDKAWVTCYRTIVLQQWKKTMAKMTTANVDRVKLVNSSKELLKMATGDYDFDKYDIYISTPKILTQFAEKFGLELLNDAFDNAGIGIKFFDEAHQNVANITKINGLTNVARTYYLSADFGQAEPTRHKLYLKMFASTPVIRPRAELAKSMQYTVGIVVRYNTHPSFNDIEGTFGKFGFNRNKYMEYQFGEDNFYYALSSVIESIEKANPDHEYKVLFLCTLIEHVDFLKDWLEHYYDKFHPESKPHIVRFHSMMPEEERDDALANGDIIVSTYQSMGVGVDVHLIRHVIALAPVNTIEDNQAAGRARALPNHEDCFYYIFCDDGFEYVRKKLPDRLAYLETQKIKKIFSIKYS